MKPDLSTEPTRFRSTVARGLKAGSKIDPTGGDFGAGFIPDAAVITRGEALGHGLWIDAEFLEQVSMAINLTGDTGAKARFTHPDVSGDGLGKLLAKAKNARVEGDKVIADLHLLQSAHDTPDGDLAGYVLKLAQEAPDAFGESISFGRDRQGEAEFALKHGATVDSDGYVDHGGFQSPDKDNKKNYRHARLAELYAVDTVDEPAANPGGLFNRSIVPAEADAVLSYALGLSSERPTVTALSVDPERAKGFASRWLERNGLELRAKEPQMSEKPTETNPTETKAGLLADLSRFTTKFGTENGTKWFTEGKTFEQALELHCDALTAQLAAKDTVIADLNKKLEAAKLGHEGAPPTESNPDAKPGTKPTGLGIKLPAGRPSSKI